MLYQMIRTCRNVVKTIVEEITDTDVPFKGKKQFKPTTPNRPDIQESDKKEELPVVKLD